MEHTEPHAIDDGTITFRIVVLLGRIFLSLVLIKSHLSILSFARQYEDMNIKSTVRRTTPKMIIPRSFSLV